MAYNNRGNTRNMNNKIKTHLKKPEFITFYIYSKDFSDHKNKMLFELY